MKLIILKTIILLFAAQLIHAQTIEMSDNQGNIIHSGSRIDIPSSQIQTFIHVKNTSSDTIHARSKKIHHFIPEGDELSINWKYPHIPLPFQFIAPPLEYPPVEIAPLETDEDFDITYFPNSGSGALAEFTIVFYYEENPDDSSFFYVNWCGEGVDEFNNFDCSIDISPNPAKGYVNVKVNSKSNLKSEITIIDILGKEKYRKEIGGDKKVMQINTSNWPNGMYCISIVNNLQKHITKKLIINH